MQVAYWLLISPVHCAVCEHKQPPKHKGDQHVAGVRRDFTEKNYLWTGRITVDLYDKSCSFTDPTISFTGVDTHQRNLAALSWLVDRLVSESSSELLSCDLNADSSAVVAQWRMQGAARRPLDIGCASNWAQHCTVSRQTERPQQHS